MRICFLVHNLNQDNGGGVFALNLINGVYKALKCEVRVLTTVVSGNPKEDSILSANWLKFIREIPKIRRILKNCDVIHALDIYPYGIIAVLVALGLKKKIIITCAGSASIIPLYSRMFSGISLFSYKKADLIIAISNFTKKEILKKAPYLKIQVINPGVDFEKFSAMGRARSEAPYILSVGSLRWRKGYKLSIKAFYKVSKIFPELKYVIVGKKYTEKYYGQMKQLISDFGLENKVTIMDSLDDADVLTRIYKNAELFFLMSQMGGHDVEGFGMVFLEAAAAGLPVVGPKGSGVEDAVLNGKNGILVDDPRDIEGFAGAIIQILKNQNMKTQMAKESSAWARGLSWESKIEEYKKLYELLFD